MKAVVYHAPGDVRLEEVPEPKIMRPNDAIIRITASAICGTDLHLVRGTMPGMETGTILGHEAVGIVEEVGLDVRNLQPGDRVVIPSTIGCGYCAYCRSGYFAQCDNSNPNGPYSGTAFYGGPKDSGAFDGLQAERARIPFANVGAVKLPDEISDDQAIMLSDIFPTGFFGAKLAEIKLGDIVAVFGCGPVGQFAIASAKLLGAARVIAIDAIPSRLEMARSQQAEVINFNEEDPVETIKRITGGIGVDRAIDAVGVDAMMPKSGPAHEKAIEQQGDFEREMLHLSPNLHLTGEDFKPGNAPSQALFWAVEALAKAGTLSIIGVYPDTSLRFPIGVAFNKNLTINGGVCNHRKYLPHLIELVKSGTVNPEKVLTQISPLTGVIDAYHAFDERREGWMKVELQPAAVAV